MLTEAGVVQSLRDIYNFYHDETGESYIKSCINKSGAFRNGPRTCDYR
jgi:hypothetical protein